MKFKFGPQRIALMVCAVAGMCFGFGAAIFGVVHRAKDELAQQAANVLTLSDSASAEAAMALVKIGRSGDPSCSPEEISLFRSLTFRSRFLKDTGHMLDRKITCSAMLGRLDNAISAPQPDVSTAAGTHMFRALPQSATGGLESPGAQLGNAYVVFSPWVFSDPHVTGGNFEITVKAKDSLRSGFIAGKPSELPISVLTANQKGRVSGTLYATRCSTVFPICATAYTTVAQVVRQERRAEWLDCGLGGLFGVAICTLVSLSFKRNRSMEQQLRRAIKNDDFRMVYQALVEISTRRMVGLEALVRWNDEEGNPISPDTFISIAEELGLISQITRLVLRHILSDFADILASDPTFRVSINVSGNDLLDPAFFPMLTAELQRAGVAPAAFVLEVTEREIACTAATADAVRTLRRAGFRVHLDDFGTGYSSLACLRELELDAIKIDRAFVRAIGTDSVAQAILTQILAIAQHLRLEVVLEGLETKEQVDYFAEMNKSLVGQGWYFGKPCSAEEIKELLAMRDQATA